MHLAKDEQIIRIYRHHPIPFLWKALQISLISLPFFFVASFFNSIMSQEQFIWVYSGISIVFASIIFYYWALFFLDKLVITNSKIIHVNWKNLFLREERDVDFADAFDVETKEKGVLSFFKFLDYGTFQISSESSKNPPIVFEYAKNPEGIKDFIYHLPLKPSKIGSPLSVAPHYDSERKNSQKEDSITSG